MIVDAILLIASLALMVGGFWLLWSATAEAWEQWRRGE